MTDHFEFERWKGIHADSGRWYKSIELLGVGGNAATFLAYSTSPPTKGQLVAIKVFRKLSKPERKASFLEEAKFLRECEHPSIMRIYDEGTYYDDNPFIVAEYLPQTLRTAGKKRMGIVEKVTYSMQLLSALQYLGDLPTPIVHRDIKPENIFLRGGACVLGDFGLAKRLGRTGKEDRTAVKESVGAGMPWYYRTPDLVAYLKSGTELSCKSDTFQLGLVLAELFTGSNPLKRSKNFTAPIELEALGNIRGEMGGLIAPILRKMMIKNPQYRPTPKTLIDKFDGAFVRCIEEAHKLEGQAFLL